MTRPTVATLAVWLLLATADAYPHQQLYYSHGLPAQTGSASYHYVPQADAASVTSIQHRLAAPLPLGIPQPGVLPPQYVLYYPGTPQHNFIPRRADNNPPAGDTPNIWNLFNVFSRPGVTTTPASVDDTTTVGAATPDEPEVTTPRQLTLTSTVPTTVEETTPKPADEASVKPEKIVSEKDEIMQAVEQTGRILSDEEKAALENLDETVPQVPQRGPDGRQYVMAQRPQFFGNYDFLSQGNMQQRFGIPPETVSNLLFFRNGFVQPEVAPAPAQPGRPLKFQQEGVLRPGSAALAFQQELQAAREQERESGVYTEEVDGEQQDETNNKRTYLPDTKNAQSSQFFLQGVQPQFYVGPNPAAESVGIQTYQIGGQGLVGLRQSVIPNQQVYTAYQPNPAPPGIVNVGPGYQNVYFLSPRQIDVGKGVGVVTNTPKKDDKDSEDVEAEQAGPSVAQAKPQAIALAGVGGVAAAAPVATAVVGAGGLAVSAPTATAVAGPSGGGTLVGPAQAAVAAVNKHVVGGKVKATKADQTYDYTEEDEERYNRR